jgi:D,D-heptose 1,7-bisphosphate phosphatase
LQKGWVSSLSLPEIHLMQAVILAGGQGTRLKQLTAVMPKPMVKIGNKPLLEHQIILLRENNIHDIIILVNHLKESIISYFDDGKKWGVSISYFEEVEPLGTVGGIKAIESKLQSDFLVLYGDVMLDMDIARLQKFHQEKKSEATLVLHPNDHPYDSDLVDVNEEGKITAFHPKPHTGNRYYRNLVNAGAYIFSTRIFDFIERNKKADFGRDIFPEIYDQIRMYGYNTSEYLKDMGTPDRWEKVTHDYENGKVSRKSYRHPQRAIFLDRDGVLNPDKNLIARTEDYELFPHTAKAIKKINESDYLAVVVTNQSVVARNLCTEEELRVIHNKLDTLLGLEHAKLDALYYCPHHPDKGYPEENLKYKIECDCRKPKPGMLLWGARDLNIDLKKSFMIGDDQRDIEAGNRAGVTTIGIMNGNGLKKTKSVPDYYFSNLAEACNFIIDDPYGGAATKAIAAFDASTQRPFIIVVDGPARAGKSTLAAYLQKRFSLNGYSAVKIDAAHWKDDEGEIRTINDDLKRILKGEVVKLPGASYCYEGQNVIIIEGSESLEIPVPEKGRFRIFINSNFANIRARVLDFYRWKGWEEERIQKVLNRAEKEFKTINQYQSLADEIVNA